MPNYFVTDVVLAAIKVYLPHVGKGAAFHEAVKQVRQGMAWARGGDPLSECATRAQEVGWKFYTYHCVCGHPRTYGEINRPFVGEHNCAECGRATLVEDTGTRTPETHGSSEALEPHEHPAGGHPWPSLFDR